jgi:hypothetical protein
MLRERLITIWSLLERAEKTLRIGYRAETVGGCRLFRLEWMEELRD